MKTNTCFCFLILILLLTNCNKPESPNPLKDYQLPANAGTSPQYKLPPVSFQTQVQGIVLSINGQPITGVKVEIYGQISFTDGNGVFEYEAASFTSDFCFIKVTKEGFFTGSKTLHGEKGKNYQTKIFMRPHGNPEKFEVKEGKEIEIPGGAKVKFLPNAFVNNDNSLYIGEVQVYINHLNPVDPLFSLEIPGGDLRAFDHNGDDVMLYSYGMLDVEIFDNVGKPLQLAKGKPSTLTIPVPNTMLSAAPATIPLWYFDEDLGVWIEEGVASLQNNNYVGVVTHFTPHNVDQGTAPRNPPPRPETIYPPPPPPLPPVGNFRGSLMDCVAKTVMFGQIQIGQIVFDTDLFGNFSGQLPSGEHRVSIYDDENNTLIQLDKKIKVVSGQSTDIGVIIQPCRTTIYSVIKDCGGNYFNGYAILQYQNKKRVVLIAEGVLQAEVPHNGAKATLTFYKHTTGALYTKMLELPLTPDIMLDLGTINTCNENSNNTIAKIAFSYKKGNTDADYEMKEFFYSGARFDDLNDITTIKYVSKPPLKDSVIIEFLGDKAYTFYTPSGGGNYQTPKMLIFIQDFGFLAYSTNIRLDVLGYEYTGGWVYGSFEGFFSGPPNSAIIVGEGLYISNGIFSAKIE